MLVSCRILAFYEPPIPPFCPDIFSEKYYASAHDDHSCYLLRDVRKLRLAILRHTPPYVASRIVESSGRSLPTDVMKVSVL